MGGGRCRAGGSRLPEAPWVRGEGKAALLGTGPSVQGEARLSV